MRLAVVGWVESRVRLGEHRVLLYQFAQAMAELPDSDDAALLKLKMVRNNLMRLWQDA